MRKTDTEPAGTQKSSVTVTSFLYGLAAGTISAYFLDPQRGKSRRAYCRDRARGMLNDAGGWVQGKCRRIKNRAFGAAAEIKAKLTEEQVSDKTLVARVKAQIGRAVNHPKSLNITAQRGKVIVSGPILEDEVEQLLSRINKVRGVREIENRLEVHETSEGIPELQGEGRRPS